MRRSSLLAPIVMVLSFGMAVLPGSTAQAAGGTGYAGGAPSDQHFHPKGKPPSEHTIKILEASKDGLPFADKRDFDEEKKGFIAAPDF